MTADQALIVTRIQFIEDKMKNDLNTYRTAEIATLED